MLNLVKTWIWLVTLFVVFLATRYLFLQTHFHFLYDQALFSLKALELWQNKELTLIGPPTSFVVNNRYVFQGSLIYYIFLILLLPTKFDPLASAHLYVWLSGLAIVPLYYGAKWLINESTAWLVTIVYVMGEIFLLPTTQLWNPNFQVVMITGLVLLMGIYKRSNYRLWALALISLYLGMMTQLHYQMIVVVGGLFLYYFVYLKIKWSYIPVFVIGFLGGMSNLILFEIRNNFYNLRTIQIFIDNWDQLWASRGGSMPAYYFTTIFAMLGLGLVTLCRKYIGLPTIILTAMIMAVRMVFVLSAPISDITATWTYKDELMTYQIIKEQSLENFNIAMFYEANATPQKYFFKRDLPELTLDDYYDNKYLFIVYEDDSWRNNMAYEMSSFGKGKVVDEWRINDSYKLVLIERPPSGTGR